MPYQVYRQNYTLSDNNKKATKTGDDSQFNCNILGNQQISSGLHQWTVKIVQSTYGGIMIGIAPSDVDRNQTINISFMRLVLLLQEIISLFWTTNKLLRQVVFKYWSINPRI